MLLRMYPRPFRMSGREGTGAALSDLCRAETGGRRRGPVRARALDLLETIGGIVGRAHNSYNVATGKGTDTCVWRWGRWLCGWCREASQCAGLGTGAWVSVCKSCLVLFERDGKWCIASESRGGWVVVMIIGGLGWTGAGWRGSPLGKGGTKHGPGRGIKGHPRAAMWLCLSSLMCRDWGTMGRGLAG